MRVLGVDGCRGGWVGVVLDDDAEPVALVASARSIASRTRPDRWSDRHRHPDPPERQQRSCVRLGHAGADPSVHGVGCSTPRSCACSTARPTSRRPLSRSTPWARRSRSRRGSSCPRSPRSSAWRRGSVCRVYEVHPEAAFAAMGGRVVAARSGRRDGEADPPCAARSRRDSASRAAGRRRSRRPARRVRGGMVDETAGARRGRSLPDPPASCEATRKRSGSEPASGALARREVEVAEAERVDPRPLVVGLAGVARTRRRPRRAANRRRCRRAPRGTTDTTPRRRRRPDHRDAAPTPIALGARGAARG